MNWILVYVVASTIGTAGFADKEACQGRVATLHEQKIEAKCVEAPRPEFTYSTGPVLSTPQGYYAR